MLNQRDEPSFLCSELVRVMYEDESCNTCCTVANLEEISAGSATLLSEEHPQAWRPIAFSVKGHDLYGIVESVDVDPVLGCFIKVKLDTKHRWQRRQAAPDHLLALCRPKEQARSIGATSKSFVLVRR